MVKLSVAFSEGVSSVGAFEESKLWQAVGVFFPFFRLTDIVREEKRQTGEETNVYSRLNRREGGANFFADVKRNYKRIKRMTSRFNCSKVLTVE